MTTSAIQALAMGLPCITTDHSGFREQITDGKNGFIAPEGDYRVLAEKILYYFDHPELWGPFGKWGREHMLRHYDAKALIDKQVEVYESLLSSE